MINWLNKPYFFISSIKFNLFLSFIIGLFVFLFLYVFQPFGMYTMQNNLFTYCLGFGVVSFLTHNIMFIVIPNIFKSAFKDENWTVGKNILFIALLVTLIGVFNWLYNNKVQAISEKTPLVAFTKIISYTFILSVFPILIFTFITEHFYREKRIKVSKEIMKFRELKTVLKKEKEITIYGNNKEDNLSFNLNDLIYISSQGNYASLFLNSNNKIKEHVLRTTLTSIISDLKKYKNIIRCHKSYIINSEYMNSISGNARGYFLESNKIQIQIPVSRSFSKQSLKSLLS